MKQFNIKGQPLFDPNTKLYSVWLGNHRGISFNSKRDLNTFLAAANRFLTDAFVELNAYYKAVFCEYRDTWFLLLNNKNGKYVNMPDVERKLSSFINSIEDQFDRAAFNMNGSNAGTFALHNLMNICDYLNGMCILLIEFHQHKGYAMHYHNLGVIKTNLIRLHHSLLCYPEVLPAGAVKIHQN